ncbi:hypothetical protein [Paludibacterium denitrificans]|uniref:hypothetical protein n=1 Tax=Paludibacterium denitrificans TaxID=2675226 RepID=UPI001E56DE75|nr:hypothetical protein [Paludibacterium denitrificans]
MDANLAKVSSREVQQAARQLIDDSLTVVTLDPQPTTLSQGAALKGDSYVR